MSLIKIALSQNFRLPRIVTALCDILPSRQIRQNNLKKGLDDTQKEILGQIQHS